MRSWKWATEQRTARLLRENASGSGGEGCGRGPEEEEEEAEAEAARLPSTSCSSLLLGGKDRVASRSIWAAAAATAAGRLR